eukprot:gene13507-19366_t
MPPKSLGNWFPNATVQKASQPTDSCSLLLFYHYCKPALSDAHKDKLTAFLHKATSELDLGGRIRVANEGLNSTISGTKVAVRGFEDRLQAWSPGVGGESGSSKPFSDCKQFKFIDDLPPDRAFKDVKIIPATELVFYGIQERDAPLANGGVHLEPKAYHEKMNQPGTVIVDVRNHYEAAIGRFDGQEILGGAKYIDPKMRKSTDFKSWLSDPNTKEQLRGKEYMDPKMRKSTDFMSWLSDPNTKEQLKGKEVLMYFSGGVRCKRANAVLMYCTGGVRCERASALLKTEMAEELKGVFQLDGGIEKYLQVGD